MSILFRSVLAGAGLAALSTGAALAYPATVTADLNLRSGPGTGYGVVATMPAGAAVDVRSCLGNGWCQLGFAGTVGYASGSYLAGGPRRGPAAVVVDSGPDYVAPEYYEYAYEYPPYWRNGYFYYWYGGHWRHVRRDRGWWDRHRGDITRPRPGRPGIGPRPGRPDHVRPVRPGRPGMGPGHPGRPDHVAPVRPGRPDMRPGPNRPGFGGGDRPGRPVAAPGRPDRGGPAMGGGNRGGGNFNAGPRGGAPAAEPRGGGDRGGRNDERR